MARTPQWEDLEMATGAEKPAWLLPSTKAKFAVWSIGGGRPFACKQADCQRWHAGIDLTEAAGGARVVAPEDATVVAIDRGWNKGSKAVFLRTDSGLFLVLGGFKLGSGKEFGVVAGQNVSRGDSLGRVLGSYGMIHFETYRDDGSRAQNSHWWAKAGGPPAGLLNPTNYVERMVGDRISLVRTVQRHEALAALGHYKGVIDAKWSPTSTAALLAAQENLGVSSDGKWGPKTEDAILAALAKSGQEPPGGTPKRAKHPTQASPLVRWLTLGGVTVAVGATVAVIWRRSAKQNQL